MSSTKVKCLICSGERNRTACQVIKLTPAEKAATQNPLDEYVYCNPCWKIMKNPATASDLMSGIMLMHLQRLGVSNAKELADKYKAGLLRGITNASDES